MTVGDHVRTLPPFQEFYADTYTVLEVRGNVVVVDVPGYVDGAAFDVLYVEVVPWPLQP